MLQSILKMNPYFRPTAHECLINKIFDPYRDIIKEKILLDMQNKR